MSVEKKVLFWIAVLALVGTVTNFVYFSPLLTLLVPLALFTATRERMERPVAWLYLYVLAFLASVLLYHPLSVVEFGFYRRDGNFVISYAPLLVLPLFRFHFDLEQYFRRFFLFALAIYGLLFARYLVEAWPYYILQLNVFGGLFYAQNAVGGFLAILGALSFAYLYHRRRNRELLAFFIVFLMLLATYSRGSILGLICGIPAWYLADRGYWKSLAVMLLIPVLITAAVLSIGYPYYKSNEAAGTPFGEEILYMDADEGDDTKSTNVLLRVFYTMPRAWYAFQHSPVLGTGVGSFDDRPYQFTQVLPYLHYNAQTPKRHTDSHAHHSYLHILAEQGMVGLGVFLTFWVSLFLYLLRFKRAPVLRDYLLIAFFAITFASFTEHRITTPSMMLPFTLSVGLLMAWRPKGTRYRLQVDDPDEVAGPGEANR
ncbi:MAG: O-antigen ligase family protein [Balneolaceae bacterium]|nr:O-antigen ligase family protein [Balneolaceae bacterium]